MPPPGYSYADTGALFLEDATHIQAMFGSFSYDASGQLTSGTIQAMASAEAGIAKVSVTGLTVDLAMYNAFITANNVPGLYASVMTGNDQIDGSSGADTLFGYSGNDIITGGAGNDTIDGGAGSDTVIFTGNRANYLFSGTAANLTVADLRASSPDGTDTLLNTESVQFADGTYAASSLVATYSLTASSASVNEGASVTFTLATTNVAANTVINYTLSGTGITTADIGAASLSGTTTVAANGSASFTVNLAADRLTEGAEVLTATVQGKTASVTVNDTSIKTDNLPPVAPKLITGSTFHYLVDPQVTMQTSLGTVVLELFPTQAPVTAANLLAYVNSGFYDGTLIHRVIQGFMVQGGGLSAGLAYKVPTYGAIALESANGLSNLRGTIAMARTSVADSATTQFFINQVDNSFLNYASPASPGYAVFGAVVSGLSVIDSMAQVATTTMGPYANVPVTNITLTSVQQSVAGSAITNAATLTVSDLEAGAQWAYSLNGGGSWVAGSGSSFVVPVGSYVAGSILVRQTDAAGNVSVTNGRLTSALVVETTAPVVSSFNPVDGAVGIALGANIVIVFSESVQRGAGSIVLTDTTNPADSRTIAVTDAAQISISGATLTINPTADLLVGAHYAVTMAAGVIKDLAGNDFSGIASSTVLDFSTVAPSYALSATTASVDEGGAVTFTVATTNVAANTVLNYTLSGAGITSADMGGASLTGSATVAANGSASFTVNLTADQLTEGAETLMATVMGQSASVTVNDSSSTPLVGGRTKYFVLPSSAGANFTDFDLSYGSVSLTGELVNFVGSTAVDAVFVRPGVTLDFTLSGSSADKIYLGGNFASYTASISGSVMNLQRGSGATLESVSFIKSTSAAFSDSVIFADGTLNSLDLFNKLKTATPLPALWTTETSIAPLAPGLVGSALNASIKAFALNPAGDTFAPAHPGVSMTVVGSVGVDTVYVPRGGVVDCTLLGSAQDAIYFTGNWGDYTKAIAGSVVSFSRSVDGYSESVRVVGNPANVSLNDLLVFADGAVHSGDVKTALTTSLTAVMSAVTGYDPTMLTPGRAPTFSDSAFNNLTNLEVGSNLILNYRESVTAVSGKYIHIVNDGGAGFHGESTVNTLNILVTDTTQVSIVGGRVSLNPTADLDLSNNYHITIDAGAFTGGSSHQASAAYDGTSTLHFSTVTPGTSALANAAASQVMNADGTLGSGHLWLDIEGIGSPSASAGTALDLAAHHYALVAKDYNAAGGSVGNDGVTTGDFYVAANNFGAGDLIYIDNQSATPNDLTKTIVFHDGTPPTTLQFAGTGLGGLVHISLAGSVATFDTIDLMKDLLGTGTSPVISA